MHPKHSENQSHLVFSNRKENWSQVIREMSLILSEKHLWSDCTFSRLNLKCFNARCEEGLKVHWTWIKFSHLVNIIFSGSMVVQSKMMEFIMIFWSLPKDMCPVMDWPPVQVFVLPLLFKLLSANTNIRLILLCISNQLYHLWPTRTKILGTSYSEWIK